ncbi:MAG: hypothetical protein IPN59_04510 [Holophaga sp.]|nr:hypothetical protein [Holophaga sp.]
MSKPVIAVPALPVEVGRLRRVEHYTLYLLNSMAAAGSAALSDGDIDYAIDLAERLAAKLVARGHVQPHE